MSQDNLPNFSLIDPNHIESQLEQILEKNRADITALLQNLSQTQPHFSCDQLILPLEEINDRLEKFWSPIAHLNNVLATDQLRTAYRACLPKLTIYATEIEHNKDLYQAFKQVADSTEFNTLTIPQRKIISENLRDFHLAGVTLSPEKKQRYGEIQMQLAELEDQFSNNVLDATQSWTYHTNDENEIAGIPQTVIAAAAAKARSQQLDGWIFTLDFPCYQPIMAYAKNRALREKMYFAYVTRASDCGPNAKQFDNSKIMAEILQLRHELSELLGFNNYAELSLATKMAKNPPEVLQFLYDLVSKIHPYAQQEYLKLQESALLTEQLAELAPWDIAYYSERLCELQFDINDELLRPYFPLEKVLSGVFTLTEKLFNLKIIEEKNIDLWHPDVRFFSIYDHTNTLRGQFYLDLFARSKKQNGAWMDDAQHRRRTLDRIIQTPIAFLTCNLTQGTGGQSALLSPDEIQTLMHEFGHGLHHLLTKMDYAEISGISGVAWDAVEFPSQFLENFFWEENVISLLSGHYQTGETLPNILFKKLIASKNFHASINLLRQLEFAIFDFELHAQDNSTITVEQIQTKLNTIRQKISVTPLADFSRFQHSFSHIFAGGYAAGYYSYLWAEVLACDAFEKFKIDGVFNENTGQSFLKNILEKGGSEEMSELFIAFRGQPPKLESLLKSHGILDLSHNS